MPFTPDRPKSVFTPDNAQIKEDSIKYGSITKTPTTLERIGTNLTSPKTRPTGVLGGAGTLLSAAGIPEEDALPMIGQGIGSFASGFPGAGFVGATGGATLGQGARQAFKSLRGEKPNFGKMGEEALTTGAIEGATRGFGGVVFRRQVANEALGQLGKKLGEMKNALKANTSISVPSEEIYMPLKEAFEGVAVPRGEQASVINKWLSFMERNPNLSSKHLIELESDLGKVAKYGEFEKGALQMPVVNKPELNTIAKTSRKQVSGIVDDIAEKSGQKGFGKTSKKYAKLRQDPDKTDVTKTTGNVFGQLAAGGAMVGLTQNPLAGLATFSAMRAAQSPQFRNLAFRALRSPLGSAIDEGAKLSLAEIARRTNQ